MYDQTSVESTFDPAKDKANRRKHGISLARALDFDLCTAKFDVDDSQDYGETRWNAIGFVDTKLHALTFTDRGNAMHVISLRRASTHESRRYSENKF